MRTLPTRCGSAASAVNLLAHIYAARMLVPRMLARGEGYLLNTASAAGLLTQIGSAPYSVTKHGAVAFAEWLSITYGDQGLKVSVLCPQAVRTNMTAGTEEGGVAGVDGMLEPEAVADAVVAGLDAERFLILPHPVVADYFRRKADDYDRWLRGMRRLQARYSAPLVTRHSTAPVASARSRRHATASADARRRARGARAHPEHQRSRAHTGEVVPQRRGDRRACCATTGSTSVHLATTGRVASVRDR